jgi:diguanylate cyclase (GGDEF)-like protein
MPKMNLLLRFSLVAIVPMALLGFVLAQILQSQIERRSLAEARRSAVLIGEAGVKPAMTPLDFKRGLTNARMIAVDQPLQSVVENSGGQVDRIKIWNRFGEVIYSNDRQEIGGSFQIEDDLRDALGGRVASDLSSGDKQENVGEQDLGKLLEVYVPIRYSPDPRPVGAFELYLSYAPIAATIRRDTREVYLVLAIGLFLLYAALFRIVAGASRKIRKQAELNAYQAFHDALTGLPNRMLFRDRVQVALSQAQRDNTRVGVMLMDLDRFKDINDSLGHHCGDELLKQVGPRLEGVLRDSDTVARLGGDEFALLIHDLSSPDIAATVANRVRSAFERPFVVQGLALDVEPSIGIAVFPDHATDVDSLVQRADVAMYVAKGAHRPFEIYEAEQDQHDAARLTLMADLHRALDGDELVLHYQPKADLPEGRVRSVEALVRWQHPERGLLYPDEFIPLAQHTGLIRPLTMRVLQLALTQCRAWRDEGLELSVAVNLAMRNLLDAQLPDEVMRLLTSLRLPSEALELEITESTIMADPGRAASVLERLSALGVRLAIDDFGTGYSSLGYLKRLPVDEIKIDKSFVMNMSGDENDAAIVRSTIDLGRNLGLEVVAEGVETEEVWDRLSDLGCDVAQGYYLSRPKPPDELTAWMADSKAAALLARRSVA